MSHSARLRLAAGVPIFGALLVCIILGTIAFNLWHSHEDLLADAQRNNENLVHVLAEQTARAFQGVDLTLSRLADVLRQSSSPGEVDRLLTHAVATSPYLRALFVTDERGW